MSPTLRAGPRSRMHGPDANRHTRAEISAGPGRCLRPLADARSSRAPCRSSSAELSRPSPAREADMQRLRIRGVLANANPRMQLDIEDVTPDPWRPKL